jgi:glycosyltransferase involved in cell wall biosynthesis
VSRAGTVHVVVPEGIDDPARPSGGNTYDRRLCESLTSAGWSVQLRPVPGAWPSAGEEGGRSLAEALAPLADGALVLVDGLVASTVPEVMVPAARRLRLVVLLHMPVGLRASEEVDRARERAVLCAASSVITTSEWSRQWLLAAYGLDPGAVHVAHPGVDGAGLAVGTTSGGSLLCVAAVSFAKGHDVLVGALSRVAQLPWRCVCLGALTRTPDEVAELRRRLTAAGVARRVELAGPRTGPELESSYAAADLLVVASRAETYGMVVTEALARGLPVMAADVGGVSEALGVLPDGRRPGLLLPPGDADALATALQDWLTDESLRRSLREAALERRAGLSGWSETASRVAAALSAEAS